MSYRHSQGYMSHPLPADFLLGNLYSTAIAHNTAIPNSLVLAAIAFVVLSRTKYLLAEKSVSLWLVGSIVDSLGFEDFSMGSIDDILRRCQRDSDPLEIASYLIVLYIEIWHILSNKLISQGSL